MDTLPTELLSLIFETGSNDPKPVNWREGEYPIPYPLLIASVCRRWREIALTTPSMWSRICVDRKFRPDYLAMWTDRSQPFPLEITITTNPGGKNIDLLGQQSCRWKSFNIFVPSADEIYALVSRDCKLEFPLLRHVQIKNRSPEPWSNIAFNTVAASQPLFTSELFSLRSLRIDGLCSQRCNTMLKNLTFLEISYFAPTHAEMVSMVSACPDLLTLVLPKFSCGSFSAPRQSEQGLPRINIPSLKTFAVSFDWNHNELPCRCLLPYFAMPNLSHLEISGDDYAPHLSTHFLISSTQSSFQKLETLRLHYLDLSVPGADLYHAFPSITSLELVDVGKLTALHIGPGHEGDANPVLRPWPLLESIKLDSTGVESLPWLVETVGLRRDMGLPLSCVYITTIMFQFFSHIPHTRESDFDTLRSQVEIDILSLAETGLIDFTDDPDDESDFEDYADGADCFDDDRWGDSDEWGFADDDDDYESDED